MIGRGPDGAGYHATSRDGLTFTRAADVHVGDDNAARGDVSGGGPPRYQWLGAAYSDGRGITFFGTGPGIWTATSRDGAGWRLGETMRVMGADPGVVPAKDGGWILTVTGPPRR